MSLSEQAKELLKLYKSDPMLVDRAMYAVKLGITPDETQTALLDSDHRRVIVNATRQWGKDTITSIIALHTAKYFPQSLTLILSPAQRQSQEQLRTIKRFKSQDEEIVFTNADSQTVLELNNGSRIISVPAGDNIRGFAAPDIIIMNEASRIPDDVLTVVRPMMATNSACRLFYISTPYGKRGFFWRTWEDRKGGWYKLGVTATQCDRISEEFLREELYTLPELLYRQEYMCEFVDSVSQYFNSEDIMDAIGAVKTLGTSYVARDESVKPLFT